MRSAESNKNCEEISYSDVVGIALCGGSGIRLTGVTRGKIPKPLVEVDGIPLINYSLGPLYQAGVRKVVFAVGSNAKMIVDHVSEIQRGELTELQACFSYEQSPAGIALGLQQALAKFDITGNIVVFDTDVIRLNLNFQDAYRFHKLQMATTTLVCTHVPKPKDSYFVVFDDKYGETGLVVLNAEGTSISGPIIKCGMMICSPSATASATAFIRRSTDIPNSWIGLIEHLSLLGRMKTYVTPDPIFYANINTPEDLEEAESLLKIYHAK